MIDDDWHDLLYLVLYQKMITEPPFHVVDSIHSLFFLLRLRLLLHLLLLLLIYPSISSFLSFKFVVFTLFER